MKKIVFFMLFVAVFSCIAVASEEGHSSSDIMKAIQIADKCLVDNQINLDEYKLISAETLKIKDSKYIGSNKWHVVFKAKNLIPKDGKGILGAGGEIFVEVDLENNKAKILGYGE